MHSMNSRVGPRRLQKSLVPAELDYRVRVLLIEVRDLQGEPNSTVREVLIIPLQRQRADHGSACRTQHRLNMPYPQPQITSSTETVYLGECLRNVMNAHWAWPDFQRVFQWSERQICSLIPSLLRGVTGPVKVITLWKWEQGSNESQDTTVYKSLGCAGFRRVVAPEMNAAIVDGGHRLNCLCYLLDSMDDNHFVRMTIVV